VGCPLNNVVFVLVQDHLDQRSSDSRQTRTKLFVGGVVERMTCADLDKAFRCYGRLSDVWIAHNPPGFAFVEYERRQDAVDAVHVSLKLFSSSLEFHRKESVIIFKILREYMNICK